MSLLPFWALKVVLLLSMEGQKALRFEILFCVPMMSEGLTGLE